MHPCGMGIVNVIKTCQRVAMWSANPKATADFPAVHETSPTPVPLRSANGADSQSVSGIRVQVSKNP